MLLQLPTELLDTVADFAFSESLGQVNRRLRKRLGKWRYVSWIFDSEQATDRLAAVAENARSIELMVMGIWDPSEAVTLMASAPRLQWLSFSCMCASMGPPGAQALAQLTRSPLLQDLTLDLYGNLVGDVGAQSLAALRAAPSLQTLSICLRANGVGPKGVQVWALRPAAACASGSLHGSPLPPCNTWPQKPRKY